MTDEQFVPTTLQERVQVLDVLRGVSLLGILLINIIAFYTPQPYIDLGSWFTDVSDIIWQQRLDIYVQGSFYPLFAMLFGYGFAMQWAKAQRIDVNFYPVGYRRLMVLFVFGVVHAVVIWWGDILMTYAITGVFLLLFLRMKPLHLLVTALIFNLIFHMFMLFVLGYIFLGNQEMGTVAPDIVAVEQAITAYATGTWEDAFMQRLKDVVYQNNPFMMIMALFTVLPYMLIGAAASKWRLLERAKEMKTSWIIVAIVCVSVGLMIKSAPILWERTYILNYLKMYVGGPILSIGYAAAIISLLYIPAFQKWLRPIAKVGRMSLTMYLLQSVILSLLFYHFGISLYGKLDVSTSVIVAIVIFAVQVVLAELWLSKFQQGPVEALWRKLTYGKLLSKK